MMVMGVQEEGSERASCAVHVNDEPAPSASNFCEALAPGFLANVVVCCTEMRGIQASNSCVTPVAVANV